MIDAKSEVKLGLLQIFEVAVVVDWAGVALVIREYRRIIAITED